MVLLANENTVLLWVKTAWTRSAGSAWLGFSPPLLTPQVLVQGMTCTSARSSLQPGLSEVAILTLLGLSIPYTHTHLISQILFISSSA